MANLTAEEIVKITLGIIGIGFLIYLSVSLIGIFTYKTAAEQAKATLQELTDTATGLTAGQTKEFLIQGPIDWAILTTSKQICICPKIDSSISADEAEQEQKKSCDKSGICQENKNNFTFTGKETVCNFGTPKGELVIVNDCFYINSIKKMILQKLDDRTNILSSYLSQAGDLISINANYTLANKNTSLEFPITYTQVGDRRLQVLTLSPILEVNQTKKSSSPFIILNKQNDNWINLDVAYTDENGNIATTEGSALAVRPAIEMGYLSLQDGSVWLSNAIFQNFFDADKNILKTTGEKHSNSYKMNLYLDINQLKQIN